MMDWENTKYIFQIPVDWYKKIDSRVFNAYGTNFIVVKDGYYGGTEIDVDEEAFAASVKRSLSGVVLSVDSISADENGNVELCAATLTANQTLSGKNTFVEPIKLSSYGTLSAGVGDLRLTLNNNGITLSGINQQLLDNEPARLYSQGADNQIATRGYVRLNFARSSALSNLTHTDITDWDAATTSFVTQNQITDFVTTGDLTDYVTQNEITDFITDADLTNYVQQNEITDFVTDSDVTSYVQSELTNYVQEADLTDYVTVDEVDEVLEEYVTLSTNQTITGDKVFKSNLFVGKSDSTAYNASMYVNGAGTFMLEQPSRMITKIPVIQLSSTSNAGHVDIDPRFAAIELYTYQGRGGGGYIDFHNDGTAADYTSRIIDLSNEFQVRVVDKPIRLYAQGTNSTIQLSATGTVISRAPSFRVTTQDMDARIDMSPETGRIEIQPLTSTTNGGYIDFHYAGSTADYTSRIIDNSDELLLKGNDKNVAMYASGTNSIVELVANANNSQLRNQPTDTSLTSKAIATCGYTQTQLSSYVKTNALSSYVKSVNNHTPDANGNVSLNIPGGTVKSVDHHSPDATGNVQINAIRTINGHNGDSVGNYAGVAMLTDLTGFVDQSELTDYVTQNDLTDFVTQSDLTDYVTQSDLTDFVTQSDLTDFVTQSELTDFVTQSELTDYVTEQDFPSNFFTSLGQVKSQVFNVVTDVTWNGTTLQKKTRQLTFSNGLITGIGNESTTTIDTPTVITWI